MESIYVLGVLAALFGPGLVIGGVVAYIPSRARGAVGPGFKRSTVLGLVTVIVGVVLFGLMTTSAPSRQEDDMAGFGAVVLGAFAVLNGVGMFIGGGIGTLIGGRTGERPHRRQ